MCPLAGTLARMSERRVGLALSGGSVRGAAHCGVIEVLQEQEIPIDVVVGTSAGSAVGAGFSHGVPGVELTDLLSRFKWPSVAKFAGMHAMGVYSSRPWERLMSGVLDDATFDDLPITFAAVACDLMTAERVLLTEGSVSLAVQASSALPVIFEPVEMGDMLLVDGGVVDNFPVTVPFELGATVVIGSDVGKQALVRPPSNALGVGFAAAEIRGRTTGVEVPHIAIKSDVAEIQSFDFSAAHLAHERGRAAALEALPAIEAALG
jgi:NTE family protein